MYRRWGWGTSDVAKTIRYLWQVDAWYAGELRVAHKQASLDELGRLADPPLTKDAIAGRIRRLLAMADKKALETGIPGTESNVTFDMLES